MFIEELKENKVVDQHFVEEQTAQKDTGEENVVEVEVQLSIKVQVEVQQSIKVQVMVEAQWKAMEIERRESKTVAKRRHVILYIATLLEKVIKILDLEQFMWTQTKQNNDKIVEWMENWKDITKEEDWASKAKLVPLFMMD